jgi:outer membrane receptor protein involved in Fe transport
MIRLIFAAIILFCLTFLQPAQGQHDISKSAAQNLDLEEIVVTGSRIKRRDFFTPSPLMTVSQEDIEFTGQWTLEEALNQMPQVTPDYGRASNNPGNGEARVALRNMGPGRTLVLLNGRRVGPSGQRSAPDLNNIPQAMIERVEIITGGTSAVYGSDALAGVVNFITKDDFSGLSIDLSGSTTEYGDAESYDVSLAYGHNFRNGRGNVTVFGGRLQRRASYSDSREFTSVAWVDDWEGNLVEGGSWAIPETVIFWPPMYWPDDPDADWPSAMFDADGNPREFVWPDDLYNYAPANYLQIPLDREMAGIFGHYQLSEAIEGYLEATYTHGKPKQNLAPTPAFGWIEVNLDNPVLTPAARGLFTNQYACDDNLACVNFGRRFQEVGPRIAENESDYYRATVGIRGAIWGDWEFDGWLSYTRASTMSLLKNDVSRSRTQQGLLVDPVSGRCIDASNGCVPVDIFGENRLSPEAVDFIRFRDFENPTERTHRLAAFFVSGPLFSLPAGDVDVAAGLEWRSDESRFLVDEALFSGDIFGFVASSPGGGKDSVAEFYGEAVVPVVVNQRWVDYLGIEIGARYSDYRYAGGVWSYKAGLEWRPFEAIRLRAMQQRSVRAPNSFELFEEQRTQSNMGRGINDHCSASNDPLAVDWRLGEQSILEKCVIQGLPADQVGVWEAAEYFPYEAVNGGNPALEPEVGQTLTLGAVITPPWLPDWTFAIDYYDLEIEGTIGGIYSWGVCADEINISHAFCNRITRDQTGHVTRIVSITGNKGLMATRGYDVQAQFASGLPDRFGLGDNSATLGLRLIWTHLLSFRDQDSPATLIHECAGSFGGTCATSAFGNWGGSDTTFTKDRLRVGLNYASGPFHSQLSWRWIRGSKQHDWDSHRSELDPDWVFAVQSVPDRQYLDLGVRYDFSEHLSARFGVNNVTDTDPPMMADYTWSNNTDDGLYDVFGRSYYLSVSMNY